MSAAALKLAERGGRATEQVPLGKSGLTVSRLALGTGSTGWARESEQTQLGQREFVGMLRHGVERGANFIDTADLYGAHAYVKAALAGLRREDVTLLTKIWFSEGAPKMTPTETARPEVERFLKELGTDYLDAVLVHCVTDPRWPSLQARMRDELSELKERGVVRAVGCSCHTLAALRVAAQDPWVEVLFARINPGHERMDPDGTVEQVADTLRLARANGKGVVGMKIYGAGHWSSPEQRRQSLQLALTTGVTDAITIGHVSRSQLDDTIENMNAVLAPAP
jgi:aryl-alcohol dehydrogenase-like predicted oxidoreductase